MLERYTNRIAMQFRLILVAGIGILLCFALSWAAFQPKAPTLSVLISTEPIPTLLPHTHEAADKVSDEYHGVNVASLPVEIPETMWVTEIAVEPANAPQGVIHHLHLVRVLPNGTRDPLKSSVFSAGQDSVPIVHIPSPAGILFQKGEQVAINAVLHNPIPPLGEGGIYKDVSISVRISGVRDGEGRHLPVQFDLPRVTDSIKIGDDDSVFRVPEGSEPYTRFSTDNPPGSMRPFHRFTSDGWIVKIGAHTHASEGGRRVDAYLNGTRVRTLVAKLLDPDVPWAYQTEVKTALIHVAAGDILSVSATYENPYDAPIEGAMGMIGIYHVADDAFSLHPPLHHILWSIEGWYLTVKDAIAASLL